MASYTTATAFLEHASTIEHITHQVPTNSIASGEPESTPLLDLDHASSSSTFFPTSSTGFILSRIIENSYTLELRWVSFARGASMETQGRFAELDEQGTLPPVRFVFPSPLVSIPFLSMPDDEEVLDVCAVTEAGYVYALSFTGGSLFYSTAMEHNEWSMEHRASSLEGRTPVISSGVDEGRVIIGCTDGYTCLVELIEDGRSLRETELKSSSSFSVRSLVSSFSSRSLSSASQQSAISSPSQLVSIASSSTDSFSPFAFGVTRDRKLKIWNLETGVCLKAVDLPKSSTAASSSAMEVDLSRATDSPSVRRNKAPVLLPPTPQNLVKLIQGPEAAPYAVYLILYVPASAGYCPAFTIYGITGDSNGLVSEITLVSEKSCSHSSASLVDFEVANFGPQAGGLMSAGNWTLWSVWEEAGESQTRYIALPEIGGEGLTDVEDEFSSVAGGSAGVSVWNAGYFDDVLRDNTRGVAEVFVEHVFYPARYPPATLEHALYLYEEVISLALPPHEQPEALSFEYDNSRDRICAVVGCTIELETSPQTGAVLHDLYDKQLKGQWLRFVAMCNESRAAALFPTCIGVCPERQVALVVMRDALAVTVVQGTAGVLRKYAKQERNAVDVQDFLGLPSELLEQAYPDLSPRGLRHDILAICRMTSTLMAGLSQGGRKAVEVELATKLEAIAESRTPYNVNIDEIAGDFFDRALEPYVGDELRESLSNQLHELLTPEASFRALWSLLSTEAPSRDNPTQSTFRPSDLTSALLADYTSTAVNSRYSLAEGLFIILSYIKAEEDGLITQISALSNASLATLHSLSSLRWLVEQTDCPSLPQSESDEAILQRFGEMKVSNSDSSTTPAFSLLSGLLRESYSPSVLSAPLPTALPMAFSSFLSLVGLLTPKPMIVDTPADSSFALRLHEVGLPELSLQFIGKYPTSAGMLYVRGLALLEVAAMEESQLAFTRAAAALNRNNNSSNGGDNISHVLPSDISDSLPRYYAHLVTLFASHKVHSSTVHFANLAIEASEEEESVEDLLLQDMWLQLFMGNASLQHYEDAYTSLMAIPYHDIKLSCLSHLISILCETGMSQLLNQYSFAGLQSDLERELAFRARNSDPLALPNYYEVSYAYHISKGDYRSAGSVMLHQSRRIGEMSGRGGSFKDIATFQCQSYLAAINALSLVESRHAWVAVYNEEETREKTIKKRKLSYYIPQTERNGASRLAEIVDLIDVRREYSVALSRLQLCASFPELERTNFTLDSEAIVALFSQTGAFDPAFVAARMLEVNMSSLFEVLTDKCIALANQASKLDDASWVALNDEAATWEGTLSSKAWRLLQRHLERHDNESFQYRLVVLERSLAINPSGKIPSWLIDSFLAHDSSMLIRTMIRYERLDEAFKYSFSTIESSPAPTTPSSTWLPYSLFDQLLAIPSIPQIMDSAVLSSHQAALKEVLAQRYELAQRAGRIAIRVGI